MNLALAVPLGVASAIAYGGAAAVQHDVVQRAGGEGTASIRDLLRDARWWLSIAGDTVGTVLQLAALATGPVVLIQPLFVLCLPVALPIRARMGGPRPGRGDYLSCLLLAAGLAAFFTLAGRPHAPHELAAGTAGLLAAVALAVGLGICALAWSQPPTSKAVALSAVTGVWFGIEAVLVNCVSTAYSHRHWSAFGHPVGLVPLVSAVVVGLSGFALSQVAFRAGSLGASFPAMLVIDPLVAVLVGSLLLGESVRSAPLVLVGYLLSAVVITLATFRLAAAGAGSERTRTRATA
jgi:hypothetical protein